MKPEAIVFDMYGTVANLAAVTRTCSEAVKNPDTFGSIWRSKQLEYTFLLSLMEDYLDFWQVTESALQFTAAATGEELTHNTRNRLMQSWLEPEPYGDAVAGLKWMKDRYPLAILSNGSPQMLDQGLKYAGLEDYFDLVLSVADVRIFKPSPKVYGLAVSRLGVEKERVVFVSSNSFDVIGAKKFGFFACWIRRTESPLDSLGMKPNLIVSSFGELRDFLDEIP